MFDMDYFDFENFDYDKEDFLERAEKYEKRANEGIALMSISNKEAMLVLREINEALKKEYDHYQLRRVEKHIFNSPLYSNYAKSITSAYVKQNRRTSYSMLVSNFYDIESYMGGFEFTI